MFVCTTIAADAIFAGLATQVSSVSEPLIEHAAHKMNGKRKFGLIFIDALKYLWV